MSNQTKKRNPGRPLGKNEINQELVLKYSAKFFAAKGYEGVKLTDIASELGVVKSLMHYHYQNKENLWYKTIEWLRDKMLDKMQNLSSYFRDLEGIALMKAFNRQYIYFAAEFPEFHQIISHEMCMRTERSKWLVKNILQPLHLFIDTMQNESKKYHSIKRIPIPNMISILIGSANIFFSQSYQMELEYGINPFDKKQIEKHADIVNDILFHGLCRP